MAARASGGGTRERYTDPMLVNVDELVAGDLQTRLEAANGLNRAVELIEIARQHPDYVECVGDFDLFAHLTWAAAQVTHAALELFKEQVPRRRRLAVAAKGRDEGGT